MSYDDYSVVDCDGHVVEWIPDMAEYMSDRIKGQALNPARNRQGVFPSIDGMHFALRAGTVDSERVTASEYMPGCGEDWVAFLEQAGIDKSVLFSTEGLSVGLIQIPRYAVEVCQAYNDYIYERFAKVSDRLRPVALLPMQDVPEAVKEFRRAVEKLGFVGGMLPSTGLPLHLGHQSYWPVYAEAERLGVPIAIHGGSNLGVGMDTFTNFTGSHVLHHSIPLMIALVSFIYHGVFDAHPKLRAAFMEGGCGWLDFLVDRMVRDENYFDVADQPRMRPVEYLKGGRILLGCEGSEETLAYVASRVGIEAFAYASDYPHEVDLPAAKHEIEEVVERDDMSREDKQAVLGDNAKRFFNL